MSERGKYIVIEGHDGTGKSTQVEVLQERLQQDYGIGSFVAHEPAGTPIADEIRTILKNGDLDRDATTNMLLFTAARHEIWGQAKRELALGKWVLSARNYLSTVAYQVWGESPELTVSQLVDKARYVTEFTQQFTDAEYMSPSATYMLQLVDPVVRGYRISQRPATEQPDTFESRDAKFQKRVAMGYDYIAEMSNAKRINVMEGSEQRSIDDVHQEIMELLWVRDLIPRL